MFDFELLAKIDHDMMSIDIDLMEWQGHLDMAAVACLDLTVYEAEPAQLELPFPLNVMRVPLKKGIDGPIIGVADVDIKTGLVRAELDDQYKELIASPSMFSIREDDPPQLNHREIKAQLKTLINPELYHNPFENRPPTKIQGQLYENGLNRIKQLNPDLDDHPFFKEND